MRTLYTTLTVVAVAAITALSPVKAKAVYDDSFETDSTHMFKIGLLWYRIVDFPKREFYVAGFIKGYDASTVTIPDYVTNPLSGTEIPVTGITANAFKGDTKLTNIVWGSNVKAIGASAFEGTSITEVQIPSQIDTIGANAFSGAPIKDVYIYGPTDDTDKTLTIGDGAFANSPANSFENCYITYDDAPAISDKVFPNANQAYLHYNEGLSTTQQDAYDNGTGWKEFKKAVPTGVENVSVAEADLPVVYYTLQGVSVSANNLTPGLYIVRQGNKTTKHLIR